MGFEIFIVGFALALELFGFIILFTSIDNTLQEIRDELRGLGHTTGGEHDEDDD